MNKNNLNILPNKVFGKLMRCSMIVLLLLVVGGMSNKALASRFERDQVWMEAEWRADLSAFRIVVHAVDWDGKNSAMDPLRIDLGNDHVVDVWGDRDTDGGRVKICNKSNGKGYKVWTNNSEVPDNGSRTFAGTDRTFYIYLPSEKVNTKQTLWAKWEVNNEWPNSRHEGSWFKVWEGYTNLLGHQKINCVNPRKVKL